MQETVSFKKKYNRFKDFFMLLLFLWAGGATPIVKFYSSELPWIFFINIIILGVYFCKYSKKSIRIKSLMLPLLIFAIWYILICLKYDGVQPTDLYLVYSAIIAFVGWQIFPSLQEFILYFERILVKLSILSLIVWGSATILPFMGALYDKFAIYHTSGIESSNYIIVSYGHQAVTGLSGMYRNLGFAWEAGRFSSILVIGLFFNLLIHGFKIQNRDFWILLVALISTFSTTGIGAFAVVIFFYMYNKSVAAKFYIIPLVILLIPTLVALPMVGDKILNNMDYERELGQMYYAFDNMGYTMITPQRFTGLYLDWLNFIHDPFLGYNINENSYMMMFLFNGYNVWLSDGLIQIISKYGIIIGSIFYIYLFKTSRFLTACYKCKGRYLFAFCFMLLNISYDFWGTGLFFYIVFYPLGGMIRNKETLNNYLIWKRK